MNILTGYQITEKLYEGANSAVYRGRREQNDEPVILKTLRELHPPAEKVARFKQEYDLINSLDLPGVIEAYSLEYLQQQWVMVLEDFGGESLARLDVAGQLDLADFLRLALEITESLGQIHRRQIIHKDLNPSNIILNPTTKQIKLIDFGIAAPLSPETSTFRPPDVLEGTLAYISPEQTGRMNRVVDYRTDFYALGVTFYELLSGVWPFQATDPMEWIHNHIAKSPLPLAELLPEAPQPVSDIIMKLLAKAPEDRYQSTLGLQYDLRRCLEQRGPDQHIKPFSLGRRDYSDRFQIPQKLYGREEEIKILRQTFDRVATQGTTEMVLVCGYAGIGKTSLIDEAHRLMTNRPERSYFISGKFDQYKRDIPYSTVTQAFRELVQQILTESKARLDIWRQRLTEALGRNGQLVIEVIPQVELIIGRQPPVPELPPAEAQNRFKGVFRRFVGVFATSDHPLILFLDDLQWTDLASLGLIQHLVTHPEIRSLLLIGAFRDNEVDASHPLSVTLEDIGQAVGLVNISLGPLDLQSVSQLAADTLHHQLQTVASLSDLILRKTNGNPFFVNQFLQLLYREGMITFTPPEDEQPGGWQWNLGRIRRADVTENVVEMMAHRITTLSARTQETLKLGACLGDRLDLATLSLITDQDPAQTAAELWPAIQEGLLLTLSGMAKPASSPDGDSADPPLEIDNISYKWLHDRVQQAAYSLIPAEARSEIHLRIGRTLLEATAEEQLDELLFDIVNHLNIGRALFDEQTEAVMLAGLNLRAGRRTKDATAYASARRYFATGLELLPVNSWDHHYELTFSLYRERFECEYLCGQHQTAEALFEVALEHARSNLDKASIYSIRLILYANLGHMGNALQVGLEGLRLLGIDLPQEPEAWPAAAAAAMEALQERLKPVSVEALVQAPLMSDPTQRAAANLLMHLISPAYHTDHDLNTLVTLKLVELSLVHGNSDASTLGYCMYGSILVIRLGDYQGGYRFGQLAIHLIEVLNCPHLKSKVYDLVGFLLDFWHNPIASSLTYLWKGYRAGLESGDLLYAGLNLKNYCNHSLIKGEPLDHLDHALSKLRGFLEQIQHDIALGVVKITQQAISNLRGHTQSQLSLSDDTFDEETFFQQTIQGRSDAVTNTYYITKLQLYFLFEAYPKALEMANQYEAVKSGSMGTLPATEYLFYYTLTLAALYPTRTEAEQKQVWPILQTNQRRLHTWAENCPATFLDRYLLVAAEMARLSGEPLAAMQGYDRAIRAARENEFVQNEGLANELAGRFYLSQELLSAAETHLYQARACYLCWGAMAKVTHLDALYPHLADRARPALVATLDTQAGRLDAMTVIKASQAISSEIVLEQLTETLMRIMLEHAGAQKGYLILLHNGDMSVAAEATVDRKEIEVSASPVEISLAALPHSLINYVQRTHENVILDDAAYDNRFVTDEYIRQNKPRSVLCLPILRQTKLIGLLYLENNLSAGAFTPDRLVVLEVLSAQMAISLDNAVLYDDLQRYREQLEELVAARTHRLEIVAALGERLNAFLNLDDLLAEFVNQIKDTFDYSHVHIYLLDDVQELLVMAEGTGPAGAALKAQGHHVPFHTSHNPVARAAHTGQVVWVDNQPETENGPANPLLPAACAEMTVPIIAEGRVMGVLDVQESGPANFDEGNANLLRSLANQAAIAIKNARLYKALHQAHTQLERRVEERTAELTRTNESLQEQIAERKRAEAERETLITELEAKNAELEQFTYTVSHDLKSPLITIRGFLGFVEQAALAGDTDQVQADMARISNAAEKMEHLLDELLELSRIGRLVNPPEAVPLADLAREAVETVRGRLERGGVAVEISPDLPIVYGDRPRLREVLENLVDNAVKYMGQQPEPWIKIGVRYDGFETVFFVQDNGSGIPARYQEKVFGLFDKLDRDTEGSGVGLAIVKRIVELHEGRVWVESEGVGHGSNFCFTLPDYR